MEERREEGENDEGREGKRVKGRKKGVKMRKGGGTDELLDGQRAK